MSNQSAPEVSTVHKANTSRFLQVVTLLLVFALTARTPNDADMWWHLSAGRAMWQHGEILLQDIFSFTRAGAAWTNAFWLSDIGMYLICHVGEFFALTLVVALLAVATMWILSRNMKGPIFLRSAIILLATLAALPLWSPRPQLISFFLLAGLDYWLSQRDEGMNKSFWLVVPLFALWGNFHGGFIWGFLLLLAFLVGKGLEILFEPAGKPQRSMRPLLGVFGFTLLAALAVGFNPNGLAIWRLPFYTVDVSMQIVEWYSPDFHRLDLHPILWLIFLLVIGLGFSRQRISLYELFKTLGFTYLVFYSQRNMAPYALIMAPVVSRYLSDAWDNLKGSRLRQRLEALAQSRQAQPLPLGLTRVVNLSIVALIAILALLRAYLQTMPEVVLANYPAGAVKWIQSNQPSGAMFNAYNWGGYLTWALPEYPVFIDGRADLYGAEIIDAWWAVANGTDLGLEVLDAWDVDLVLLDPGWPVIARLEQSSWQVLYQDVDTVLLGRP